MNVKQLLERNPKKPDGVPPNLRYTNAAADRDLVCGVLRKRGYDNDEIAELIGCDRVAITTYISNSNKAFKIIDRAKKYKVKI